MEVLGIYDLDAVEAAIAERHLEELEAGDDGWTLYFDDGLVLVIRENEVETYWRGLT
jgi:hypothetical protein